MLVRNGWLLQAVGLLPEHGCVLLCLVLIPMPLTWEPGTCWLLNSSQNHNHLGWRVNSILSSEVETGGRSTEGETHSHELGSMRQAGYRDLADGATECRLGFWSEML